MAARISWARHDLTESFPAGTYDLVHNQVRRIDRDEEPIKVNGPEAAIFDELLPHNTEEWRESALLAKEGAKPFDLASYREGHLTPVYFGSALRTFGVRDLIVVESVVMILVFAVIVVTFLVDLAYAAIDPRLRKRA